MERRRGVWDDVTRGTDARCMFPKKSPSLKTWWTSENTVLFAPKFENT